MSNRLSRKSSIESGNDPSPDTARSKVTAPAPVLDGVTGVPRRWLFGAAALLGLITLLAVAFSMWTILHVKLTP